MNTSVNEYQFAEVLVRRHHHSPVVSGHAEDVEIGQARRDRQRIETIVTEVAKHRDHLDADVCVSEELHGVLRITSSCRTADSAYARAART